MSVLCSINSPVNELSSHMFAGCKRQSRPSQPLAWVPSCWPLIFTSKKVLSLGRTYRIQIDFSCHEIDILSTGLAVILIQYIVSELFPTDIKFPISPLLAFSNFLQLLFYIGTSTILTGLMLVWMKSQGSLIVYCIIKSPNSLVVATGLINKRNSFSCSSLVVCYWSDESSDRTSMITGTLLNWFNTRYDRISILPGCLLLVWCTLCLN